MAVNFTPNLGLAKPTGNEIARKWTDPPDELYNTNNDKLRTLLAQTEVQSYVPTLTAITDPVLGDGSVQEGKYTILPGNFVIGWYLIKFGTTGFDKGLSFYNISLPFPIDATFHDIEHMMVGEGAFINNSANRNDYLLALIPLGASQPTLFRMWLENYNSKLDLVVGSDGPVPMDVLDAFTGDFFYKADIP